MNFGANHPRHIQLEIGFRKKAQKARQAFGASPGGPGCTWERLWSTCGSASGNLGGHSRGAQRRTAPEEPGNLENVRNPRFLHPLRRANEEKTQSVQIYLYVAMRRFARGARMRTTWALRAACAPESLGIPEHVQKRRPFRRCGSLGSAKNSSYTRSTSGNPSEPVQKIYGIN